MRYVFSLVFLCVLFVAGAAHAQESLDHLPVPRWAALASNEVNLRTGPGKRYPIDWQLRKKGLPVEIIQEFDNWRRVREPKGADGWVHKSMLTGMRKIMTENEKILFTSPSEEARVVARLEKGVIAALKHCQKDWCEIGVEQFDGWVSKKDVWGIYRDEIIE